MTVVLKPKRGTNTPGTDDIVSGEIAIDTSAKKLFINDSGTVKEIGGGGGGGSTSEITQSSHGFAVKDAIRHNGSAWVKAQANAASTLALGIVTAVADSNNFTIAQSGRFELSSHGLTVGQWFYLDASNAGGLTATEPEISQPIVYVESTSFIYVYQYRPTNLLVNGTDLIQDNSVTSAKIVNGTIVAADLADDAVTTAKIADDAITSALIADDAITTALIADDAITTALIADDAITTALIADDAITAAKIADSVSLGAYNGWAVKTGTYTAANKDQLIANNGSAFTITLPAGTPGNTVIICNAGAGTVTVGRNGSQKINSAAEDGTIAQGASAQLVYVDDTIGWFEI